MSTDYRALCAELVEDVCYLIDCVDHDCCDPVALMECRKHLSQTRAALAQPEPEGVTDKEIEQEAIANADTDDEYRAFKRGAFFVQERISRPTIKPEVPPMPVPVAERPEPEGVGDVQIMELMPQQLQKDLATVSRLAAHGAGPDVGPGLFRVSLNTGIIEHCRAVLTRYGTRPQPVAVSERWLDAVMNELAKAEAKHPEWPTDPLHAIAIIGEEFGELTQAVLQVTYEPGKSLITDVRREAVQTAAMALRFLQSMDAYVYADDTNTHRQGSALPVPGAQAHP